MKPIPPPGAETQTVRRYWRSLDQLADSPDFRRWMEREFPAHASEMTDTITRRHFVKIMSASFLLAGVGLTGCRRPVTNIFPFANAPEDYTHGVPRFYATSMPIRNRAVPLLVKTTDGRPIKIEGNPLHPQSRGATDHFAQASVLDLYDPDRAQRFTRSGNDAAPAEVYDFLRQLSDRLSTTGGKGFCVLMGQSSSPSRLRLQQLISRKFPRARWFVYEPVDFGVHWRAATLTHPRVGSVGSERPETGLSPSYSIDKARVIVSLDHDFLGLEEDSYLHIRGFAQGRRLAGPSDPMNRLYAVESLLTLTGANADHRLRVPSSCIQLIAAHLAEEVMRQSGIPDSAGFRAGLEPLLSDQSLRVLSERTKPGEPAWTSRWITECALDLLSHRGESLVLAGHRQPLAVHVMAQCGSGKRWQNGSMA
ncbi:MAG: TAT-variant-translocated molybdopterin oxidoreductase [Candidatus Omnitrophica bacterium]|nr:TAT-variant-translocated molybdopterin oxidoreductase [Candidatus Omnitrophota bacterium]